MTQLSSNLVMLIAALALLVFFIIARKAHPALNAQGTRATGVHTQNAHGDVLKVASFNIQTGKSNTGKRDISRAAQQLKGVDIAGVQEVYAASWFNVLGLGRSQSDAIAALGQFNYVFNPTRRRWFRDHRGNTVLTQLPVNRWQMTMLPDQSGRRSYRNVTVVESVWNDSPFVFINTHLHTSKGQGEQLDIVLQEFAQHSKAVLVGDFNTNKSNPRLLQLLQNPDIIDAIAVQNLDPNEQARIDWIFVKGFDVVGGAFAPKGVSDHPYYEIHLR